MKYLKYFESQVITRLNYSYQGLTSLPELPDTLKELYCMEFKMKYLKYFEAIHETGDAFKAKLYKNCKKDNLIKYKNRLDSCQTLDELFEVIDDYELYFETFDYIKEEYLSQLSEYLKKFPIPKNSLIKRTTFFKYLEKFPFINDTLNDSDYENITNFFEYDDIAKEDVYRGKLSSLVQDIIDKIDIDFLEIDWVDPIAVDAFNDLVVPYLVKFVEEDPGNYNLMLKHMSDNINVNEYIYGSYLEQLKKRIDPWMSRGIETGLWGMKKESKISSVIDWDVKRHFGEEVFHMVKKEIIELIDDEMKKLKEQEAKFGYWWLFKEDRHPIALLLHSVLNLYGDNFAKNFIHKYHKEFYIKNFQQMQIRLVAKIEDIFTDVACEKMSKLVEEYPEDYLKYYQLSMNKLHNEWIFDDIPQWIRRANDSGLLDLKNNI